MRAQDRAGRGGVDPLAYFHALTRDEQRAAIKRLASEGMTDYGIASATRLSVEQVRQVIAQRCEQ